METCAESQSVLSVGSFIGKTSIPGFVRKLGIEGVDDLHLASLAFILRYQFGEGDRLIDDRRARPVGRDDRHRCVDFGNFE